MGLCNVYNFSNNRSVKLSDSYDVKVKLNETDVAKFKGVIGKYPWYNADDTVTLPECLSVTIPEVGLKSETYKYGNNSRVYVYPDYEKPDDLKIELMEHIHEKYSETNTQYIGVVELLVNIFLSKLFDAATYSYKLNDYIPEMRITVYSNDFTRRLYYYVFKNLKLSSYNKYTLDYSSTDICKWSLTFSYQAYYQEYELETRETAENLFGENKSVSWFSEQSTNVQETNMLSRQPDENDGSDEIQLAENNTNGIDVPVDNAPESVGDQPYKENNSELEITPANAEPDKDLKLDNTSTETAGAEQAKTVEEISPEVAENPTSNIDDALAVAANLANAQDLTNVNSETSKPVVAEEKSKSLGNDDRIDELAYQMMRGTYDNGNPRVKKTLAADYTEEERKAAQKIVNKKEWNALKDRHDARVAAENERKTELLANANNGLSREPAPKETGPIVASTNVLGGDAANDAYQAALAKAQAAAPKENTALASNVTQPKTEVKETKTSTESIATKTTTSKENGKTVTTTTTVAQFEGFDPERERKIADYAAEVYKKNLSSGKVKNEQLAYDKAMLEAQTAYAQGKIK